jgi:hypothetical protein
MSPLIDPAANGSLQPIEAKGKLDKTARSISKDGATQSNGTRWL